MGDLGQAVLNTINKLKVVLLAFKNIAIQFSNNLFGTKTETQIGVKKWVISLWGYHQTLPSFVASHCVFRPIAQDKNS